MEFHKTEIQGLVLIKPKVYQDDRGFFFESLQREKFREAMGFIPDFVQQNQSVSIKGTLRGLHFQEGKEAQAKLVRVVQGEVLDVVVDLRPESKTYGKHLKFELSSDNNHILFIPKGMAHGFLTVSPSATFVYDCDNYYAPQAERGIIYNDSVLDIDWEWPSEELVLSERDKKWPGFNELDNG